MIRFMVIAAPRSGTAWAANWLTTERSTCVHDPLWTKHWSELDEIPAHGRTLGMACTGIALFPIYLQGHPARKLIVHRSRDEIDASLLSLGMPALGKRWDGALERIEGMHCNWRELYSAKSAKRIYEYLLGREFDPVRHANLVTFNVQMDFEKLKPDPSVGRRLMAELRAS